MLYSELWIAASVNAPDMMAGGCISISRRRVLSLGDELDGMWYVV